MTREGLYNFTELLNTPGAAEAAVLNLNFPMYKAVVEPCENDEVWLIEFYTHWCPTCQAFMARFYKLAAATRASGVKLRFAAVNCGADIGNLCGFFKVIAHPMMTLLYKGSDVRVKAAIQHAEKNQDWSHLQQHGIDVPKRLFLLNGIENALRQLPEEYRPPEVAFEFVNLADDGMGHESLKLAKTCPTVRYDRMHMTTSTRTIAMEGDIRLLGLPMTKSTFESTLKEHRKLAILFTGNTSVCEQCPLALTVWNHAKRKLDGVTFAVFDGFADNAFTKRHFKKGEVFLPTIMYFNHGKCKSRRCKEYTGPLYAGTVPEQQFQDWLINNVGATPKSDAQLAESASFLGNGWPVSDFRITPLHRFHDAAQALVYALEDWIKPDVTRDSPNGFTLLQLQDVHAFISLVAATFPIVGGFDLVSPLGFLRDSIQQRVQDIRAEQGKGIMCAEEWHRLVKNVSAAFIAAGEVDSGPLAMRACKTDTCRLWILLHIITVSDFAQNRTVASSGGNQAAFDAITVFLRRYFTCQTCRLHFLDTIGKGSHGLEAARSGGPRELALWWWRFHVEVSQRVAMEGGCTGDRQWPPIDLCEVCWRNKDSMVIDENAIVEELVAHYWPQEATVLLT